MAKSLITACLLVLLAGCAANKQHLTREEWLKTTSRDIEGVTKEQVISAAENLFHIADGDDFLVVHNEEGFIATRGWGCYMVFGFQSGIDSWQLKVIPTASGVKANLQIFRQMQAVAAMPTGTPYTTPGGGAPVDGNAIYDLFWSRLDYLLGKRADWTTCKIHDEKIAKGLIWGDNSALCNGCNISNNDGIPPAPGGSN